MSTQGRCFAHNATSSHQFYLALCASNDEVTTVKGWITTDFDAFKGKSIKLTRCYSMAASGDGGKVQGFHKACDGKGPIVAVVQSKCFDGDAACKAKGGWRFGAVADESWSSIGSWVPSNAAFLYCLDCSGSKAAGKPAVHQLKLNGNANQHAFVGHQSYGPFFGGAYDLVISHQHLGVGPTSSSNLGSSYTCPYPALRGALKKEKCQSYLAGSQVGGPEAKFIVQNYEVYTITEA